MSKGVILIALNNSEVDYIKQAVFSAKYISKNLNLPVSLITDNVEYLNKNYNHNFDQVLEIKSNADYTYKKYSDGLFSRKNLEFKNTTRSDVYELTPYDETLVLDTDLIICNDNLLRCFQQPHNFLIYKNSIELSGWRNTTEFDYISETSVPFYWATGFFFRKTELVGKFFNLIKHIQDNWDHYRIVYQINNGTFRNDFAFSIAIHIMNGYQPNDFAKVIPDTLFYCTDKDYVQEINDNSVLMLLQKEDNNSEYFPCKLSNSNVHIMNKFSLNRIIDSVS